MTSPDESQTSGSTLRRAYLTMERMQRRIEQLESAASEPIAIVGIGCRFPGGVVDTESFWDLLAAGTDAVSEIPADRWDVGTFHSAEPRTPGRMSTRWGGFMDQVDRFDHEFFGITRREAMTMDPQQRVAMEVVWQALENAGQDPSALAGSKTGVFMGVCSNDFASRTLRVPLDASAHASTGTAHSILTGRISYTLDLRGPSVAVDTACSSSLVAVHQAVQSLRSGESDLALGGGVNVILSPIPSIAFSQFPGMVAPDGRCKTFDVSANGYVRAEGCGVLVLKRLSDAVKQGDEVLAVLRGGAVNQDGRSAGITAPSGAAQREVLRGALAATGVAAEQVSYVEAHGTGTTLGDPIEVDALAEVYGRAEGPTVYLGSSKPNIGHAEAASGIAGLIKAALCVRKGAIPKNVHFTELNPHLSFAGTTFAVPTEMTPWPEREGPRTAGVSSFGFSGTNAHLLVEQPPEREAPAETDERRPLNLLTLSAKSEGALATLAEKYRDHLATGTGAAGADLAFSANTGRAHFRHRLAALGSTREELAARLEEFTEGMPSPGVVTGTGGAADVVFLFPGQGPQRVHMARELYETQPAFRRTIDRCDEILRPMLEVPLLTVLYPEDDSQLVYETAYSQPALFAVEFALAELWRSWGVEPAAVLGHSFGEYVAACFAGAMSLEDGLKLMVARGRLMTESGMHGAMATVFAPEREVAEALVGLEDKISIAAANGPGNTSISGDRATVEAICERFTARGVKAKLLRITTASHSPLIEPVVEEFRKACEEIEFSAPRIPLVSNLTGELWAWDKAPDADYWCTHLRRTVRFGDGVDTLLDMGYQTFVELSPAPTLLGLLSDSLPTGHDALLVPSLRPNFPDWEILLDSLARLYTRGADIDWHAFDAEYRRDRVPVPTYAFTPTRCWPDQESHDGAVTAGPEQPAAVATAGEPDAYEDADLLHDLDWEAAPALPAEPAATEERATWLVLSDGAGVGTALAGRLTAQGSRAVRVVRGAAYRHDGDLAEVRPGAEDLQRLIGELDLSEDEALHVVHLWAADSGLEVASVAALLQEQQDGCMSAVHAVQALAGNRSAKRNRLWLVTRGAVRPLGAASGAPSVAQSTLWGLGRSLQQEHTGLWGGLVDLDPDLDAETLAELLLRELGQSEEDQSALYGDKRYVARMVRRELPAATGGTVWRTDATYLVTGGLGGLGLAVARSMVLSGARHLVLAGRTPLPPRATWSALDPGTTAGKRVAAVRELEALGASVTAESMDVSDEQAVRDFLDRFEKEGRQPVRGVVHAAGVGEITPLLELGEADLERQLRAKAAGAWVLDRVLGERELDFFVLFSSVSSLLSSPFVAGYAASNAYLDALARSRRSAGKPAVSINWGIWGGLGMAASSEATPGLSAGMGTLSETQALRMFHRLLRHTDPQISVVPVDWSDWGRRFQDVSGSALLSHLVGRSGSAPTAARAGGEALPSRAELLALGQEERLALLAERLRSSIAVTMRTGAESVGPDQPLQELGLDSLMAVEARNEIEGSIGVFLPISVFLSGASVKDVAAEIVKELGNATDAPAGEDGIQRVERAEDALAQQLLAELADLDEDADDADADSAAASQREGRHG
ncbi:type I polyketide synthase [Streptomyces sp. NA04227]|uniref:type I polyketide synthase n=1 Tax=Streptomyces sp. NA04227 TaxID=2742136 RepID=UPI00159214D6|nr:type I polyketide synthase [Streptomyces sp. NA04227]QKW05280.1 type I polyketide synthase [Streptomyces sp. NA04227]